MFFQNLSALVSNLRETSDGLLLRKAKVFANSDLSIAILDYCREHRCLSCGGASVPRLKRTTRLFSLMGLLYLIPILRTNIIHPKKRFIVHFHTERGPEGGCCTLL